jgi:hypothetical protein
MKGFPKHFNIKQDVLNCLLQYPEETKGFIKRCFDERQNWITTSKLDLLDAGVTDATHRISECKDDATGVVVERYQEEFMDDPNCQLFRLGFTVEEAQNLLA